MQGFLRTTAVSLEQFDGMTAYQHQMKAGNSAANKNCPGNCETLCSCLQPALGRCSSQLAAPSTAPTCGMQE